MWDENTTVSKREGHPYFDWPSDGSCHSQALSQLAEQLAGTAYSLQLTICSVRCTVPQQCLCFNSSLLHFGLSCSGSLPVLTCCWWNTNYTLRRWGETHRGSKSGGERKYKEGSSSISDISDRGNSDFFSH